MQLAQVSATYTTSSTNFTVSSDSSKLFDTYPSIGNFTSSNSALHAHTTFDKDHINAAHSFISFHPVLISLEHPSSTLALNVNSHINNNVIPSTGRSSTLSAQSREENDIQSTPTLPNLILIPHYLSFSPTFFWNGDSRV